MKICRSSAELRSVLAPIRSGKRTAFVPTMGCLHEGHSSLLRRARELADIVVASIYVNPLQFGPNEDLDAYPRTPDADAAACEAAGVDVIFCPENLYAAGPPLVSLRVKGLDDCLCGASRAAHFDGVATVVNILFNIVQADIAVFGEKDWQQLAIIRRMATDLHLPVEIVGVETVREAGGLAMSSRNRYLSDVQCRQALALNQALKTMQDAAAKQRNAASLIASARSLLAEAGLQPEYLEIRSAHDLTPVQDLDETPARVFIACRVGPARLIDNMSLPAKTPEMTETP